MAARPAITGGRSNLLEDLEMPTNTTATAVRALASLIDQFAEGDGVHPTPVPRLHLIRSSHPTEPIHAVHQPAVCFVAQGRKQVMVGSSVYAYDNAKYLVVSVDVPIVGQILEATPRALSVRSPRPRSGGHRRPDAGSQRARCGK